MTEQTQEKAPANLSIEDLAATVRFIDIACQRGIVRGEEMLAVGTLRGNISDFVEQAKTAQEAQKTEAPADMPTELEDIPAEDVE